MYFTEFSPSPDLAAHVSCYWHMRVDDAPAGYRHEVLPDGCTSVIVSTRSRGESTFTVQGPRIEPLMIPVFSGDHFWGIRFWPDTGATILGREASALSDLMLPALSVFESDSQTFFEQIARCTSQTSAGECMDGLIRPRIRQSQIDPIVRAAVLAIVASRGEPGLSEISCDLGIGQRQLQRRFKVAVGLTMKQFARIRRLRSTLGPILTTPDLSWASVAAEFGYSDQAHLIREFVALAGMTPTALSERISRIGHGKVNP